MKHHQSSRHFHNLIAFASWILALQFLGWNSSNRIMAQAEESQVPGQRLLVPAYFYPKGVEKKHWDRLLASPARPYLTAIVNPASGPGARIDPNYGNLLSQARDAKLHVIGYVSTSYAKRPLAEVKKDVDRWLEFYPEIQGIFADEQASGPEHLDYYAQLYDYVRKQKRLQTLVSNPGTVIASAYLTRPALDVACLLEGSKGLGEFQKPAGTAKLPPRHFAALLYKVADPEEMRRLLQESQRRGIGHVYITDAAGDNPWNRLPTYWDELERLIVQGHKKKQ